MLILIVFYSRFVHNKSTKNYQRQPSSGGPTSYIKPRRPPPPVPRQLPRLRPGGIQRQPHYTQNNSTQSFQRTLSVPYRLYSISEKEEEIYGNYCQNVSSNESQKVDVTTIGIVMRKITFFKFCHSIFSLCLCTSTCTLTPSEICLHTKNTCQKTC